MSTLVFVDPEISTQADGAQSSRVPVPLPKDPFEAIRQAYLVRTDTESKPFEDPIDTEATKSPHTVAPPTSLLDNTPTTLVLVLRRTARMAVRVPPTMSPGLFAIMEEVAAMSDSAFCKSFRSSYESLPSSSPPDLPLQKRYQDDKDRAAGDEGLAAGDEGPGIGVESLSLGQSFGSVPESKSPERVSALRQSTLTTWMDPEDGIVYIDVLAYLTPALPAQPFPSPEWSFGSLPISPAQSIVPLPISSPMIPLIIPSPVASLATAETGGFLTELGDRVEIRRGLICNHTVRLEELSPTLFERSLEHEQERVAVTFRVIWRSVLALESWAGQTDAQRAALWHDNSDTQRENQELRLQLAKERRVRLDLAEIVDNIRRGQEPRGD
nr:hypothetical protein [Tanacetum cinerariifolium]